MLLACRPLLGCVKVQRQRMHAAGKLFLEQTIKLTMTLECPLPVEDRRDRNNLEMTFRCRAAMAMAFILDFQMTGGQRCLQLAFNYPLY